MSGFTIDITGDFKSKFDNIKKEVQAIVDDELNAFGLETVAMAKSLAPVDEGFLRNSITYEKQPLSVTIVVAANYAAYLEFGTRKFADIYVAVLPREWQEFAAKFKGSGSGGLENFFLRIHDWVKRKGIDESAAYPIAIKILRIGIKPKPFLVPAVEANRVKLINNLKKVLNA